MNCYFEVIGRHGYMNLQAIWSYQF